MNLSMDLRPQLDLLKKFAKHLSKYRNFHWSYLSVNFQLETSTSSIMIYEKERPKTHEQHIKVNRSLILHTRPNNWWVTEWKLITNVLKKATDHARNGP